MVSQHRRCVELDITDPSSVPPAVTGETDYNALFGDNVTLTCSADGTPEPTISWSKLVSSLPSGHIVDGGDLQLSLVRLEDSGIYRCLATNAAGNASLDVTLTVQGKNIRTVAAASMR